MHAHQALNVMEANADPVRAPITQNASRAVGPITEHETEAHGGDDGPIGTRPLAFRSRAPRVEPAT